MILGLILLILITISDLALIYYIIILPLLEKKKSSGTKEKVTYTHYLLYDEETDKYIVKEFDDSVSIIDIYCNTQTGAPLLMLQTQGWVPKPNSLGSKISHYKKDTYIITDEYIFTDEKSAILKAIKLNKLI